MRYIVVVYGMAPNALREVTIKNNLELSIILNAPIVAVFGK